MAQLSDDCFAFGGKLLTVAEAIARIGARVPTIAEAVMMPLAGVDGEVLADDVRSPIDLPPFDNSAVDGWAVRHGDLRRDGVTELPVSGRVAAGDMRGTALDGGTAIRIFTGARMPAGADTVFMQEDVSPSGEGRVLLPAGLARGANRRLAGEDIAAGSVALPAGRRLRPQDVALAAALGLGELPVRRRLRVGVLSTGDELVEAGTPLAPGRVYDSNRAMLLAMLRRLGVATSDLGMIGDEPGGLARVLADAAAAHDLLLTSGGVSTGEEDHTRRAMEASGRLVLWRLAIKPGRPLAMGLLGGVPVIGLPGNPVAVFVTFAFVVRPLLARLAGETYGSPAAIPLPLNFRYRKREGRREYVRVRLATGPNGSLGLDKHPQDGAGVLTSLTETDGLAELPESVTVLGPGDPVGFIPYSALL